MEEGVNGAADEDVEADFGSVDDTAFDSPAAACDVAATTDAAADVADAAADVAAATTDVTSTSDQAAAADQAAASDRAADDDHAASIDDAVSDLSLEELMAMLPEEHAAPGEVKRLRATVAGLRRQVADLQGALRLSDSERVAQLRADFTVAFDAAVEVSKQFGQALLVGDRLHGMMEAARELLVRNECELPLDDMLKWQRLHGEMVRKLCESGVELRKLKSARPSVQRIARLQNVPIE